MEFRIADTFTDGLARLTADEQKSAKTTAFDLQLNPASFGNPASPARQGQGQELLVRSHQRRPPLDRASDRLKRDALLRRPPRRCLPLGGAARARDASEDGCGSAR